jgi:AraC-like DNA-binding protein
MAAIIRPGVATGGAGGRIVFSSDQLSGELGERARRALFRDIYHDLYGPLEIEYAEAQPFSARFAFVRIGGLGLATNLSTIERFVRTPHCVAAVGSDDFQLAVNLSRAPMQVRQQRRETVLTPGAVALVTDAEAGEFRAGAFNRKLFVTVPRKWLLDLVGDADDLLAVSLGCDRPATRHLRRYLDMLLMSDERQDDARINEHIATTLLDLVALVLGAGRDAEELARVRGLRAARLQSILVAITAGYDDPDFSVRAVASRVGLSPRYVQDLLHEAGPSFTERVLEKRLQKARALLADGRPGGRKVVDIAFASGFNEVSHFNRAFRRRFGVAPSDMRAPSARATFR